MRTPQIIRELRAKRAELIARGYEPPFGPVLVSPAGMAEIEAWRVMGEREHETCGAARGINVRLQTATHVAD